MNSPATGQLKTRLENLLVLLENLDYTQIGKVMFAVFSLATVHFGVYLATFSLKSVILLDLSAAARYFFNVAIIFAVASGTARFIQFVGVKFCSGIFHVTTLRQTVSTYISGAMAFYLITTAVFCILFAGPNRGGKALLIIFVMHFGLGIMIVLRGQILDAISRKKPLRSISAMSLNDLRSLTRLQSMSEYVTRMGNRGELVLLVFFVVIVFALARVSYVKDNYRFMIGHDDEDAIIYSVFLNTSDGLLVWTREPEEVHFLPWGTIGFMKLESR